MMPRALREAMRDSIPWWRSKVWKKVSKVLVAAGGKRVQGPYLGKLSTPMHAAAAYNGHSYIKKHHYLRQTVTSAKRLSGGWATRKDLISL